MAENLGMGFGDTARVEMLPEDGGCKPKARAGLAARNSRARWALTCCLVALPILAGLTTYLLVGQLRARGEACVFQTPKGQEFGPSHQRAYVAPGDSGEKPRAHLTGTSPWYMFQETKGHVPEISLKVFAKTHSSNFQMGTTPFVVRQTPTQRLENQFPALHWEHELGLAFTKNRMNYTNKFLVIPEPGDYFVYSQVTFRGTASECGGISQRSQLNKPDSIIVVITKVTDSYPEPTQLLMGTKSVCEIGSNWFQPIYLGAMFSLQEGDKLMVNVSDIALVDYTKEDKTFFGAFLL
ncbi:hypothetical protein MC885_002978 [Smutsia gigantea]|nr:hypothetical protein MC885_002978 [Smutsia gigantea]